MQWSELSSVKVATLKRQILKRLKTGLSPICCPHSRCQSAIRTALVSGRSLRLALATGELDAALLCRVGGSTAAMHDLGLHHNTWHTTPPEATVAEPRVGVRSQITRQQSSAVLAEQ